MGRGGRGGTPSAADGQVIRRVIVAPTALAQITALRHHYRRAGRPEANTNLAKALRESKRQIIAGRGLPAPRPYPELAAPGDAWVHAGSYWFAYRGTAP